MNHSVGGFPGFGWTPAPSVDGSESFWLRNRCTVHETRSPRAHFGHATEHLPLRNPSWNRNTRVTEVPPPDYSPIVASQAGHPCEPFKHPYSKIGGPKSSCFWLESGMAEDKIYVLGSVSDVQKKMEGQGLAPAAERPLPC